jgi:hypothetical protein
VEAVMRCIHHILQGIMDPDVQEHNHYKEDQIICSLEEVMVVASG